MNNSFSHWEKKAPMNHRRHDMRAFTYENNIYVVSGAHEETLDSIEKYNVNEDKWEIADFKFTDKRGWYASVLINHKFFVIGGKQIRDEWLEFETGIQYNYFNDVDVLDLKTKTWSKAAPMKKRRAGVSAAYCNGKIYVCGGIDYDTPIDNYKTDLVDVYDVNKNEWTESFSMPEKLMAPIVESVGSKVYVIGGLKDRKHVDSVYMYDTELKSWTQVSSMNYARRDSGSLVIDDKILVFGGCSDDYYTATCEMYDTKNDKWDILPNLPEARAWMGTALLIH